MDVLATNTVPSEALKKYKEEGQRIRAFCVRMSSILNSPVNGSELTGMITQLAFQKDEIVRLAAFPRLIEYAQVQEGIPTHDVTIAAAELAVLIGDTIDEIQLTPTTSLITGWSDSGAVYRDFTVAQAAGVKAKFDLIVDKIK